MFQIRCFFRTILLWNLLQDSIEARLEPLGLTLDIKSGCVPVRLGVHPWTAIFIRTSSQYFSVTTNRNRIKFGIGCIGIRRLFGLCIRVRLLERKWGLSLESGISIKKTVTLSARFESKAWNQWNSFRVLICALRMLRAGTSRDPPPIGHYQQSFCTINNHNWTKCLVKSE